MSTGGHQTCHCMMQGAEEEGIKKEGEKREQHIDTCATANMKAGTLAIALRNHVLT